MIDSHCHLTHDRFAGDLDEVIERAKQAGLTHCISIGTGVEDAEAVRKLTHRFDGTIFGTAGLDPFTAHRVKDEFDANLNQLEQQIRSGAFCAVGEIGLDYHYDLDTKPIQREKFERQLNLAKQTNLPVVIHVREAHDDMAEVLANHGDNRGVIHSFTGGPKEAERYLDLGWYLAFNGVATFKSAAEVRDAAKLCPKDRILVETDGPYLAPVPHRGRRCEPAHVRNTLECLATERAEPLDTLIAQTTENARVLFNLP